MNILPQKFIFSLGGEKIVKNFPSIFQFQGWKSFLIIKSAWEKFAIFGEKLQILGGKSIKIGIFWVKSFPPLIFFPIPPYFYLAEYSPMGKTLYNMQLNYLGRQWKQCCSNSCHKQPS